MVGQGSAGVQILKHVRFYGFQYTGFSILTPPPPPPPPPPTFHTHQTTHDATRSLITFNNNKPSSLNLDIQFVVINQAHYCLIEGHQKYACRTFITWDAHLVRNPGSSEESSDALNDDSHIHPSLQATRLNAIIRRYGRWKTKTNNDSIRKTSGENSSPSHF